jgi:uncharacterized membrane protein YeaQ/YmgE (transglycosylase-associated protein family)
MPQMDVDAQTLLIVIIVGVVAGWLAVVLTGCDLIRYLAVGVAGAFVGQISPLAMHLGLPIDNALAMQVASAALGAFSMIAATRVVMRS